MLYRVTVTVLPNADCSLNPSMTGLLIVTSGSPFAATPLVLPVGAGRVASSSTEVGVISGPTRMAKSPRPKVVATNTSGSPGSCTARPVLTSTLPRSRVRAVTCAFGSNPPAWVAPSTWLGNSVQVWPLLSDW